jgi:hypothetical protein
MESSVNSFEKYMRSSALGKNISTVEVTRIAKNGIWLQVGDEQHFLPFKKFRGLKQRRSLPSFRLES